MRWATWSSHEIRPSRVTPSGSKRPARWRDPDRRQGATCVDDPAQRRPPEGEVRRRGPATRFRQLEAARSYRSHDRIRVLAGAELATALATL
jgi:hypothetical protein